ncbi:putative glycosyltransferase protein [Fulvivirga imtechensis AK7]|uniref:Putative glycosyltransferase protein n=1 Tax=Fulvivirga imtechensis AK7 TaxID=1237149 RepID=L8JLV3_9BACT|nr:glycosyltransferase family 4 protein [Fulvivirga imtechensis]ELR68509.1 putative glycosyltransferase protein [Fulvivirga imtechensis AK7]
MKLLISAYACIPDRGSEPGHGWHWTFGNAVLGNEVWCFTTKEGEEAIRIALKRNPSLKIHVEFVEVPGWINYLYRFQPFVYLHYLVWQHKAAKKAAVLDKEIDFDLLHHVTLGSLQLGSGLWRLKKPFVFGPVGGNNFAPVAFKKYFAGGWHMEIFRRWTSNLLTVFNPDFTKTIQRADLILATNNDTLKKAKEAGGRKINLFLDSALPHHFFSEKAPFDHHHADVLRILWVGRIFARKGLPLVLEALKEVKTRHIPFHLTILGDGKLGHRVSQWLLDYGIQEHVTWRGHVSWHEVKTAYQEHDVFMFCSLRDSFGSQFLEAMAFGLPIITLNHQGAGDHIPSAAAVKVSVTTPQSTVKELAEAVEYMYKHPQHRYKMGQNGYAFARQHQWDRKIGQVNRYYEEILERKRKTTSKALN